MLHWLRLIARRAGSPTPSQRRRSRPAVELLEERQLLATFTVSNTNDLGAGSLRQAILDANGAAGLDTINVTIAGTRQINLLTALPSVADPISLNSTSSPTRIDGTALSGSPHGLTIASSGSTIRGLVITRFLGDGMNITGNNNIIQNNWIGTAVAGGILGNSGRGVWVSGNNNSIGGASTGNRNVVNYNGAAGVAIASGTGNLVRLNTIDLNSALGIDLGPTGVTPNDTGDADTGANNLQNYPVLSGVETSDIETSVTLSINSRPSTTYTVDFYTSAGLDATGFGEGATTRGSLSAPTDASGNVVFIITFPSPLPGGHYLTATLTDPTNNTSEFARSVQIPGTLYQFGSLNTLVAENAGLATVTVTRTGVVTEAGVVSYAVTSGSATAGQDFVMVTGTLSFVPMQSVATFAVPILNDDVYEGDETVTLTLSNPNAGAALGVPNPANLTIQDDETPVPAEIRFCLGGSSTNENAGQATITVHRFDSTAGVVTVDYMTNGGTATAGDDYFAVSGQLSFAAGQAAAAIVVNLIQDAVEDPNETIVFELSNPTGGALLGTPSSYTLLLFDNPGLDPSAREQEQLEYLNRMRLDPAAELPLLLNSSDPDVNSALTGFSVDQVLLAQQWATLTPAQPLAWNAALYNAAVYHSLQMLAADEQSHQVPGELDFGGRLQLFGYNGAAGENVFAFTRSMFHAHAGFAVDWGFGPGGIQDPPGHRNNMMNAGFREIGIGVVDTLPGKSTGPFLTTQDLGARAGQGNPYLLGVVFSDLSANTYYTAGEGRRGVNVAVSGPGGNFNTTTTSSGSYQLQAPVGTYTVTFSGGGLPAPVVRSATIVSGQNKKLDLIVPNDPSLLQFSTAGLSVNENGTMATVTITRTGNTAGAVTALLTGSGSATPDADYASVSCTITFAAGETSQVVMIPIIDDAIGEPDETVLLSLSNPTGNAFLGGQNTTLLTIIDNEATAFRVTTFVQTSTGFSVQFSAAIDTTVLNLYDMAAKGAADLTLVGASTGPVRGTVVVDPFSTRLTFVRTGGMLPADAYTLTLRSSANAFKRQSTGVLLDGNYDNTAGGDWVRSFTTTSSTAVLISAPEIARGPGQTIDLPLRLSSSAGVTSISLVLVYNSTLLNITAASVSPGLSGATVSINTSTPGMAVLTFNTPTLSAGVSEFVRLTATIPDSAGVLYTRKHVLDLTNLVINGGLIAALDDDGLHANAYLGDTTGNATYSSSDALKILRTAVGLDRAYDAHELADPSLIADINGNGRTDASDANRVMQRAVGMNPASIPPLPASPPLITNSGPDPLLTIPKRLRARAGGLVVAPVNLDRSEGLESADLAISFDPRLLEVVEVRRGRLTTDFDLFAVNIDNETGTLRVGLGRSSGPIGNRGAGDVVKIIFRVKADAATGRTILNLRQNVGETRTQLNEGGLDLVPDPSNTAGDALDGVISIRRQTRTPPASVAAIDAVFAVRRRSRRIT